MANIIMADVNRGRMFDEEADICFWDYDGSPVYSCSFTEIRAATELPQPPDHSMDAIPLAFQGWNWTLQELQAETHPVDVGALYYSADDKMHWFYKLEQRVGLTCSFKSTQSSRYTVDWGDGSQEEWGSGTENGENPTHTYDAPGTYHVSVAGAFIPTGALRTEGNSAVVGALVTGSKNSSKWLGSYWKGTLDSASITTFAGIISASIIGDITNLYFLKAFVCARNGLVPLLRSPYCLRLFSLPGSTLGTTSRDYLLSFAYSLFRLRQAYKLAIQARFLLGSAPIQFFDGKITTASANILEKCFCLRRVVLSNISGGIGNPAFAASPIEEIWCNKETPPTLSSTACFGAMKPWAKIHVPASAVETYKTATNWATYADNIVGDWTEDPVR